MRKGHGRSIILIVAAFIWIIASYCMGKVVYIYPFILTMLGLAAIVSYLVVAGKGLIYNTKWAVLLVLVAISILGAPGILEKHTGTDYSSSAKTFTNWDAGYSVKVQSEPLEFLKGTGMYMLYNGNSVYLLFHKKSDMAETDIATGTELTKGGRIYSKTEVSSNGHRGKEYYINGLRNNLYGRIRMYSYNKTCYAIFLVGTLSSIESTESDGFFESFKLLE